MCRTRAKLLTSDAIKKINILPQARNLNVFLKQRSSKFPNPLQTPSYHLTTFAAFHILCETSANGFPIAINQFCLLARIQYNWQIDLNKFRIKK